jgi:hypothetical protein
MDAYEMPILRQQELQCVELPFQWNQQYTTKHYKSSPVLFLEIFWKRYPKNVLHFEKFWIHMPPSRMDTQLYTRSLRTKCQYLQDLLPSWGPTWKQNTGAYQYLAELKSYLDEARRTHKQFSEFGVAAEIMQQSKKHLDYNLIATAYLTYLTSYTTTIANLPAEFRMNDLINALATNRSQHTPIIPYSPIIKKFGDGGRNFGGNGNESGNSNRNGQCSPFKYRNEVQCEACQMFGHCIGLNVCRIAAKVHHVNVYKE